MHTTTTFARRLSALVLCVALTTALALPVSAAGFGSSGHDGSAWFGASFVQWVQGWVASWSGETERNEEIASVWAPGRNIMDPDGHDLKANGLVPEPPQGGPGLGN